MSGFSLSGLQNVANELRAQYYPKNETEKKVYEALSALKNWGASTTLLNDIATDTYDYQKYPVVMNIIWTLMNSEGRTWKQLFKCLSLLEFLIKNGAERCIEETRDHMRTIRQLQDYNFYEGTADKGGGVRDMAKKVIELLSSNETIRDEREKARRLRDKFVGIGSSGGGGGGSYSGYGNDSSRGGGGRDRYGDNDSGSGGRSYNSRYGNDSYSGSGGGGGSSRDRYGSESNSYSGGGIDNDYHSKGATRYGGGAYDTEHRAKYSDEATDPLDTQPTRGTSTRYAEDHHSSTGNDHYSSSNNGNTYDLNDDYSSSKKSITSGTGKIKISIKDAPGKHGGGHSNHTPAVHEEVDLFADPTASATHYSSAPAAPVFDAFGDGNAHHAPSNSSTNFFDAGPNHFQSPAPVAPVADPYHSGPAHGQFDAFGAQPSYHHAAPVAPNHFDVFTTPTHAPVASHGFGAPAYGVAPQPIAQNHNNHSMQGHMGNNSFGGFQQAPNTPASPQNNEFGDFESAKPVVPVKAVVADPWGSLVNLDGMKLKQQQEDSAAVKNKQPQIDFHSSFSGLDGFSKTQPNSMRPGGVPLSSMGSTNIPIGAMGAPRPMTGGYPMAMGGYPGGGAPMGGAPMGGAPMGGVPMGGGMHNAGGYGASHPPAGYPPAGYPPAGYPPSNYPPAGYPPSNYPPAGYPQVLPSSGGYAGAMPGGPGHYR